MGLFGGSTKTTTNEKFDSGPSSWQKPYLDSAFSQAQTAYNTQAGTPYYQGDTYAGMSAEAKAALDAMRGYATGTGLTSANQMSQIGTNLAGYATQSGGLIDKYLQGSNADAITAEAGKYADNPYIQSQIDAAAGDVRRNLTEDILPAIDRNASAGGGINSSRAGIASGIAQRGAADRIANIGANIRSQAWSQGLDMARDSAEANLTAANAFGALGSQGIDALRAGADAGYGAFDRINASNTLDQADRQGYLDEDFEQWQGEDQRAWDLLNRYYGIVGGNQWGQSGTSSSTSKTKQSGGILGQVVGAASTAASLFSDPRLKRDVKYLGEREDGLGVYSYNYIWNPEYIRHVGVMADEVRDRKPEALGPEIDGFMTVNYELL